MNAPNPRRTYEVLLAEATRLAGGLTDLSQRAAVYHHLFVDSGRNHAFPLIAAHGALWAGGYFRFGLRLGRCLAWQYAFDDARRKQQLARLDEFASAFRDINRRVCVDTYVNYHFAAQWGDHPKAAEFVPLELLDALNRIHAARVAERELSDPEKRSIFEAHFLHEQRNVVGPAIERAVSAFDWPLLRHVALRPLIRFAYFPARKFFWFRDFSQEQERIANGLRAFDLASAAGWSHVDASLRDYRVLPSEFFAGPVDYFARLLAPSIR